MIGGQREEIGGNEGRSGTQEEGSQLGWGDELYPGWLGWREGVEGDGSVLRLAGAVRRRILEAVELKSG